jgi:hypothetical protein
MKHNPTDMSAFTDTNIEQIRRSGIRIGVVGCSLLPGTSELPDHLLFNAEPVSQRDIIAAAQLSLLLEEVSRVSYVDLQSTHI